LAGPDALLGRGPSAQAHWQGFALDRGWLQYSAESKDPHRTWEELCSGRPPAVCFWYRDGGDILIGGTCGILLVLLMGDQLRTTVAAADKK